MIGLGAPAVLRMRVPSKVVYHRSTIPKKQIFELSGFAPQQSRNVQSVQLQRIPMFSGGVANLDELVKFLCRRLCLDRAVVTISVHSCARLSAAIEAYLRTR